MRRLYFVSFNFYLYFLGLILSIVPAASLLKAKDQPFIVLIVHFDNCAMKNIIVRKQESRPFPVLKAHMEIGPGPFGNPREGV